MAQNPVLSPTITAAYDLHCHVLPDWDDGPAELEISLQMAERAAESGIRYLCATPHVGRAFAGKSRRSVDIPGGVAELQKTFDERGIPVTLVAGAELLLGAVDFEGVGPVKGEWTYGTQGKFALVESPIAIWPDYGNHLLHTLQLRGVTPVIAHPERYINVQNDVTVLDTAVAQGALLQITAASLLGRKGRPLQNCCFRLLDAGMVHVLASDAHGPEEIFPGEAVELVIERVGESRARQIFVDNPAAVINGTFVPSPAEVVLPARKIPFFAKILGGSRN